METLKTDDVPEFGEDPISTQDQARTTSSEDSVDEGRSAAIFAYIPFLCFVPLTRMRDNKFALHHGRQGLILLMLEIVAGLFLIPSVSNFFWVMIIVACAGSAMAGIVFALQGKMYKLPIIGELADRLKL